MIKPRLAVDCCVAGYLIMPAPPPPEDKREAELYRRAVRLRDAAKQYDLCLPAPAMAEVLHAYRAEHRAAAADALEQVFQILQFDRLAAHRTPGPKVISKRSNDKQCLKVDTMIVACAIRHGAVGLCTFDTDPRKIAEAIHAALDVGGPEKFLEDGGALDLPFPSDGTSQSD